MNDVVSEIMDKVNKAGEEANAIMNIFEYRASPTYLLEKKEELRKRIRRTKAGTVIIFILCAGSLVYKFFA